MISKETLEERVAIRRQELQTENERLTEFRVKVGAFVSDIKGRSVIYNLVKNLSLWKELEQLAGHNGTQD